MKVFLCAACAILAVVFSSAALADTIDVPSGYGVTTILTDSGNNPGLLGGIAVSANGSRIHVADVASHAPHESLLTIVGYNVWTDVTVENRWNGAPASQLIFEYGSPQLLYLDQSEGRLTRVDPTSAILQDGGLVHPRTDLVNVAGMGSTGLVYRNSTLFMTDTGTDDLSIVTITGNTAGVATVLSNYATDPISLGLASDGRLVVSDFGTGELLLIDPDNAYSVSVLADLSAVTSELGPLSVDPVTGDIFVIALDVDEIYRVTMAGAVSLFLDVVDDLGDDIQLSNLVFGDEFLGAGGTALYLTTFGGSADDPDSVYMITGLDVPEPSTLLLVAGAACVALLRRRRT